MYGGGGGLCDWIVDVCLDKCYISTTPFFNPHKNFEETGKNPLMNLRHETTSNGVIHQSSILNEFIDCPSDLSFWNE